MKIYTLKNIYQVFILLVFSSSVNAQNIFFSNPEDEGKDFVYEKEWYLSGMWHTNGLRILFNSGTIIDNRTTKYYQASIGNIKHRKEQRQNYGVFGGNFGTSASPKPFRFGKINHFYTLNGSIGTKKYISEKAKVKNVRIAYKYSYGVNIGVLRPYYLNIRQSADHHNPGAPIIIKALKYSGEDNDPFLLVERIHGGTGLSYGWGELKIRPGLNLTGSMFFEFGESEKYIKSLEVGCSADVFFKKIPLMIGESDSPIFLNLFAAFSFGVRK